MARGQPESVPTTMMTMLEVNQPLNKTTTVSMTFLQFRYLSCSAICDMQIAEIIRSEQAQSNFENRPTRTQKTLFTSLSPKMAQPAPQSRLLLTRIKTGIQESLSGMETIEIKTSFESPSKIFRSIELTMFNVTGG